MLVNLYCLDQISTVDATTSFTDLKRDHHQIYQGIITGFVCIIMHITMYCRSHQYQYTTICTCPTMLLCRHCYCMHFTYTSLIIIGCKSQWIHFTHHCFITIIYCHKDISVIYIPSFRICGGLGLMQQALTLTLHTPSSLDLRCC